MTAAAVLQVYAEQAVLLGVGLILFRGAWAWSARAPRAARPRGWRDAGLLVIAASLLLPLATRLLPRAPEIDRP